VKVETINCWISKLYEKHQERGQSFKVKEMRSYEGIRLLFKSRGVSLSK
jgi:hypothetical protein